MKLRDYQKEIFDAVISSKSNDLIQLDTGAGKTPIAAALCEHYEHSMLVAHRNILIQQASQKLAEFDIKHEVICSAHTRKLCAESHRKLGGLYIERGCENTIVASIGTLVSHYKRSVLRLDRLKQWVIIVDEAHHVVLDNQWGLLKKIFPNCRIIGLTATPARNDGESLSSKKSGMFDNLVQCEFLKRDSVSKLINANALCDFSVYSPAYTMQDDIDPDEITIAADPVKTYKALLLNKRAVVMCPSIANANELAEKFRNSGVSAACINSMQSQTDVARRISLFSNNQIRVLCNVDMVGEGFDVPGIDGIILIRKTQSFIAYKQWIGRALRPAKDKSIAVIIDLVGNVEIHGMPGEDVIWDLENPPRGRKTRQSAPCRGCGMWYAIRLKECPSCCQPNALLFRENLGGRYFKLINADISLVRKLRDEIKSEGRILRLNEKIVNAYSKIAGPMGHPIASIQKNFIQALIDNNEPFSKINDFIFKTDSLKFWVDNYTLKECINFDNNKAMGVYKKWADTH